MIKMTEYAKRRKELMKNIGPTSIVILPAAPEAIRSNDTHYPYRQDSDFYYLTGFEEPEAIVILAPKRSAGEFIVFNRPREREKEIWDGFRAGQEGVCKHFGADQAFPITELEKHLPQLLTIR